MLPRRGLSFPKERSGSPAKITMTRFRTLSFIGLAVVASMVSTAALALPTAALYVTDRDPNVEDPLLNPWGVSVLEAVGSTITATDAWRHGALFGSPPTIENRDIPRGPIAIDDRVDVAGRSATPTTSIARAKFRRSAFRALT